MRVLHICNDYCGSKVHSQLYSHLSQNALDQIIYTYYRDQKLDGKNRIDSLNVCLVYSNCLHLYHRVLYHLKIRDVYRDLSKKISLKTIDIIHATTLFSDGAIAYKIFKHYDKPYIVTIRNTDVNCFLKYAFYSWIMGIRILLNASKIIFISPSLQVKFCNHPIIRLILPTIKNKMVIQPNGIDQYWLDHVSNASFMLERRTAILFVGRLDYNKNILRLIKAVLQLNTYQPFTLTIVGSGPLQEKIEAYAKQYPHQIDYLGQINDKAVLKDLYRSHHIFALPSKHETFGLVYLEALTQGLPILYTKREGIDGLFNDVGIAIRPRTVTSISNALLSLSSIKKFFPQIDFTQFDWHNVSINYKNIYNTSN